MNIARIYLRVSTEEQDLTRQAAIEHSTRAAGYYVAGIYREKASGARTDRPELLRMIADLQPGSRYQDAPEHCTNPIRPRPAPHDTHDRAIAYANVVNPSKKWFTFSGL